MPENGTNGKEPLSWRRVAICLMAWTAFVLTLVAWPTPTEGQLMIVAGALATAGGVSGYVANGLSKERLTPTP